MPARWRGSVERARGTRQPGQRQRRRPSRRSALARHPSVELLVDLVTFDEPYFITPGATQGTIVTALPIPDADALGVPRIRISAQPGDLAALAQRALDGRQPVDIADAHPLHIARQ